MEMGDFRRRR